MLIILALAACRGEPVPRDYQNAPPDMTSAPQSSTQTPSQHGMGQPAPEPSAGKEGTAGQTTIPDTPPVTTTPTTTAITTTATTTT